MPPEEARLSSPGACVRPTAVGSAMEDDSLAALPTDPCLESEEPVGWPRSEAVGVGGAGESTASPPGAAAGAASLVLEDKREEEMLLPERNTGSASRCRGCGGRLLPGAMASPRQVTGTRP